MEMNSREIVRELQTACGFLYGLECSLRERPSRGVLLKYAAHAAHNDPYELLAVRTRRHNNRRDNIVI